MLWFPAPASFTGEDCAEFHLHGGLAVVDGVALALTTGGARLAEPGEFTRRAFENGKLDLDQAEGVADLVDAETASQARQALDQLQGGLGRRYAGWRDALVASLGLLEAAIDFPEEDAASQVARSAEPDLRRLASQLNEALSDAERGRRVREGYRIAIIGAPNSGKSSLINVLVDRDVAIVTPTPGTTRDVIEAAITLSGYRVILADTAGLRHSREVIEAEGIRRAERAAEEAALRLWVVDRADGSEAWMAAEALLRADDICVINKSDLGESAAGCGARRCALERGLDIVNVSARQSDIGALTDLLERRVADALGGKRLSGGYPHPTQGAAWRGRGGCDARVNPALSARVGGGGSAIGRARHGARFRSGGGRGCPGSRVLHLLHRQVVFHVKQQQGDSRTPALWLMEKPSSRWL